MDHSYLDISLIEMFKFFLIFDSCLSMNEKCFMLYGCRENNILEREE